MCRFHKPMFVFHICAIGILLFGNSTAYGADYVDRIEIPSSFNPVGSGARAIGMGGAFIAVADDATAASWNPGGLIQLELPELSVVFETMHRTEGISFSVDPSASSDQSVNLTTVNYFSAAYPFTLWNHNMIVSLNYQSLYDMTREWDFSTNYSSNSVGLDYTVNSQQDGKLSALGLAYSIQITPNFSAGLTFNIWNNDLFDNSWDQKTLTRGGIKVPKENESLERYFETYTYDEYSFSGFNMNLGFLWRLNEQLTLGAVLKTPFEADIDRKHSSVSHVFYTDQPVPNEYSSYSDESGNLEMPLSTGIGAAYRFSKSLTVSLDIYGTLWDNFLYEDSTGRKVSPINNLPEGEADIDPTVQVRLGAEYLWITQNYVFPIRGGVFYDPAPAQGSPDDIYGFSIGTGVGYKQFIFDMAYQYRFGKDIGKSALQTFGFSEDLSEHKVYASIIYHFE